MSHQPSPNVPLPVVDEFDPAQAAMADALRKSFSLLKWLMIIVVVFYLFSGLFQVRPGYQGFVFRMGALVQSSLEPGWHWSWPFPIDEVRTESLAGERTITASFMWQLSELQQLKGIQPGGGTALRPGRDWYMLTGDLNILHAEFKARYSIVNARDYLTNVIDITPKDDNKAEYEILHDSLCAAAIQVAARRSLNDSYVDKSGYLNAVHQMLNARLKAFDDAGRPLGIQVNGVLVTDIQGFDTLMPPVSVLAEFDAVQTAEQQKGAAISQARGKEGELLSETAGPEHAALAAAVKAESVAMYTGDPKLAELSRTTDQLLASASGEVRRIIKQAEAARDALVNEAAGDAAKVSELAEQYAADPNLVMQRLRLSMMRELWERPTVSIRWIPEDLREVRLVIPRDAEQQERATRRLQEDAIERMKKQTQLQPVRPQGTFRLEGAKAKGV